MLLRRFALSQAAQGGRAAQHDIASGAPSNVEAASMPPGQPRVERFFQPWRGREQEVPRAWHGQRGARNARERAMVQQADI